MSDDDFDGLLDDDDDEFLRMVDTLEHSATPVAACAAQDTPRHNASSKCNGDASAAKIPFVMRTPDSRGGAAPGTAAGSAFATGLSSLVAVDGRSQQHMGRAELTNQPATKRARRTPPPESNRDASGATGAAAPSSHTRLVRTTPAFESPAPSIATPGLRLSSQRRFPGPAGLLPRLVSADQLVGGKKVGQMLTKTWELLQNPGHGSGAAVDNPLEDNVMDAGRFDCGAWLSMAVNMKGFTQYRGGRGVDVNMRNTISRVVEGETRGKIPMLCVMVKQLTLSDTDASALLVDPTGQMKGTLHRRVFDTYSAEDLAVGAVIVLKQVSVFSPAPRRFYLNVTPNNILKLFRASTPMPSPDTLAALAASPSPSPSRISSSAAAAVTTDLVPHRERSNTMVTPMADLDESSAEGNPRCTAPSTTTEREESSAHSAGTRPTTAGALLDSTNRISHNSVNGDTTTALPPSVQKSVSGGIATTQARSTASASVSSSHVAEVTHLSVGGEQAVANNCDDSVDALLEGLEEDFDFD